MFQYVAVAIIFSVGHPWKRPTWVNAPFCAWLAIVTVTSIAILFSRDPGLYTFMDMQLMPARWHATLAGYAVLALFLYAVLVAALWVAKREGFFRMLKRLLNTWRGRLLRESPHKRASAFWRDVWVRGRALAEEMPPSQPLPPGGNYVYRYALDDREHLHRPERPDVVMRMLEGASGRE